MRMRFPGLAVAACAVLSLSAQPRQVGVFVDGGSRGGGAVTWVRLAKCMQPAVELKLIEGADVRGGALEGLDLLIMPGGHSGLQKKNLGPEGIEKVRDYIRRGGRYFGTCAGLSLAQTDGGFLKLVPYRKRRPEVRAGDATLAFDVSEKGAELLGIKAGRRNFCYHSGPQLELKPNPEKTEFKGEVIATFAGSVDQNGKGCPTLAGLPAAFYGDFGEGKVLVTSFHPEYFPFTWDFVAAGISALTGVKTSFSFPRKNPRTVKVAFFAPVVAGREDAEAALELSEDPDISMWPVTGSNIDEGWLELADVVVLPGGDDGNSGHQVRARAEDFAAFAARGGKLVTYGEAGAKRAPKGTLTLPSAKGLSTAIKGLWGSGVPSRPRIQAVAHRGLHTPDIAQNSAESFSNAWASGAKWIETDFHLLKSGRILCVHCHNELRKLSGEEHVIADLADEEIARIDIGKKAKMPRPYRMPYLEDVLATVPKDCVAQCEIKLGGRDYPEKFDAAVRGAGLSPSNILVTSFHSGWLKDFKAKCPQYETMLLVWLGKDADLDPAQWIARAKSAGVSKVCPGGPEEIVLRVTRADADAVRAAGYDFRFFGVNSKAKFARGVEVGITAFTTDHWHEAFEWAKDFPEIDLLR